MKPVLPIEGNSNHNESGVHQPLKPIGEMLKELELKKSNRKKDEHIKESKHNCFNSYI